MSGADSGNVLSLSRFDYHLPDSSIAQTPLADRDSSKLLVYRNQQIDHFHFRQLPEILPTDTCMVFNETQVIPVRLIFYKESGARIEIFLLEPLLPIGGMEVNLNATESVTWKAMVGNAKKWKEDQILMGNSGSSTIKAQWYNKSDSVVILTWDSGIPFSVILEESGKVPLPPYIHREADLADQSSYQTIYATRKGAVAAPTAGLHFTPFVMKSLSDRNLRLCKLTLHVGAGTFQPVVHENVWEHPMHSEYFEVPVETLKTLASSKRIAAVGTTSLRTLESLYWLAVLLKHTGKWHTQLEKEVPYTIPAELTFNEAMNDLIQYCELHQLQSLSAFTAIMIVPGYKIRSANMLITNFHMPKSTLIMLVEAFIGLDWKKVYSEALKNNYRFLSYGDSSILFREV